MMRSVFFRIELEKDRRVIAVSLSKGQLNNERTQEASQAVFPGETLFPLSTGTCHVLRTCIRGRIPEG